MSEQELLENYVQWKWEQQCDPPMFSPKEYLTHLQNARNSAMLDEARVFVKQHANDVWSNDLVKSLIKILEGK